MSQRLAQIKRQKVQTNPIDVTSIAMGPTRCTALQVRKVNTIERENSSAVNTLGPFGDHSAPLDRM